MERPVGAFTAQDVAGQGSVVSRLLPMPKNCTRFEPVSATARTPSLASTSIALGPMPALKLELTEGGTAVPPSVSSSFSAGIGPSAMDVDARLGVLAVAETGSNLVQFFGIGNNLLTTLPCPATSCAVNAPTG